MLKPKLTSQLTRERLKEIKLVCFDCDGVTVREGTKIKETLDELSVKTFSLSDQMAEKLNRLKKYFTIVFTSGRSLLYLTRIYEKILWNNIILQGENGIFTLFNGFALQQSAFSLLELNKITKIKRELRQLSDSEKGILGFEPKQFIITVHCNKELENVVEIIHRNDPENDLYCLWSGEAYDIGPKRFNKASGIEFLMKKLGLRMKNILTVGNDPNDKEMIEKAGVSVTTNSTTMPNAEFTTSKLQEKGGEEIVDKLFSLISNSSL